MGQFDFLAGKPGRPRRCRKIERVHVDAHASNSGIDNPSDVTRAIEERLATPGPHGPAYMNFGAAPKFMTSPLANRI